MQYVPKDMLHEIALYLTPQDILSFCLSFKNASIKICDSEEFWTRKWQIDYGNENPNLYYGNTWKQKYQTITQYRIIPFQLIIRVWGPLEEIKEYEKTMLIPFRRNKSLTDIKRTLTTLWSRFLSAELIDPWNVSIESGVSILCEDHRIRYLENCFDALSSLDEPIDIVFDIYEPFDQQKSEMVFNSFQELFS